MNQGKKGETIGHDTWKIIWQNDLSKQQAWSPSSRSNPPRSWTGTAIPCEQYKQFLPISSLADKPNSVRIKYSIYLLE